MLKQKLIQFVATGFYSGLSPRAPGTIGSLAVLPLLYFALQLEWKLYIILTLALFFLGVWVCSQYEKTFKRHDASEVVVDEFAGMFVAGFLMEPTIVHLGVIFVVFRIFDILKPFPISYLDRKVPGGMGVMIDDIVAGFFTSIVLQALVIQGIL